MTRLLGCICNQPERLRRVLEPTRSALIASEPVSRWGVGYIDSGQVLLRLHPRSAQGDVDFFAATDGLCTDYLIAAACREDGLSGNVNTPPFRFRNWMCAMDELPLPEIEPEQPCWDDINQVLREHIPSYLCRNITGKTASEHAFHLFLAMLNDGGRMEHPNLTVSEGTDALQGALALIFSQLTKRGVTARPGNLIVTNGRFMLAVRLAGPLFVRQYREQLDPKRPENQFKSALVISTDTETEPNHGFEAVLERQVVQISRDVRVDRVSLG